MSTNITFSDLEISQNFIQKLTDLSITEPTAIQKQVIPLLKSKNNVLFQSETGTGKTFAYLLPLLEQIEETNQHVQIMIVAPTHELASQIKSQVQILTDYKVALLIGGVPIKRQIEVLKEKPSIIIGGPARLLELVYLKKLKLNNIKSVVLDEADRLFSPELRDSTTNLLQTISTNYQLVACSATIAGQTEKRITNAITNQKKDQQEIQLKTVLLPPEDILRKKITHIAIYAESRDKTNTLKKLLLAEKPEKAIIFTARPDQVDILQSKLQYHKIDCCALHSKIDKVKRKQALDKFRSGKCKLLITSDLAARGLDIPDISHIIQMDLPSNEDFFIHRAGRTGRAGKEGKNIVIGDAYEMRKFAILEKKLKIIVYPRVLYKGKLVEPIQDTENNETT